MKKIIFTLLITSVALTLTSCLTSLLDLATYKNITTDDRLAGSWEYAGKQLRIEKLGDSRYKTIFEEARKGKDSIAPIDSIFMLKHYILTYQEKGLLYTWVCAMIKVADYRFVSLKPDMCEAGDKDISPGGMNFQSACSFAKLEWSNSNSFQLRFLNGDRIRDMVLGGQARIKHEYDPLFGTFIITASSQELEEFLEKYGSDDRLYSGGNTFNLARKR